MPRTPAIGEEDTMGATVVAGCDLHPAARSWPDGGMPLVHGGAIRRRAALLGPGLRERAGGGLRDAVGREPTDPPQPMVPARRAVE
ncbi:hypothetical protein BJF78_13340 [Pseudonocardia sp. CNS-139]|nr:hypothetical protein BJF78_13340 [Pseudonocardia sp. CNS-139]